MQPFRVLQYGIDNDRTLALDELGFVHYINCTVASVVTFPYACEGFPPTMFVNYGTAALTFKTPAGATMFVVKARQRSDWVLPWPDDDGVIGWPLKGLVFGASGEIYTEADVIFRSSSVGVVHVDTTDSHFDRVKVTADAIAITDTGATEPGPSEPESAP